MDVFPFSRRMLAIWHLGLLAILVQSPIAHSRSSELCAALRCNGGNECVEYDGKAACFKTLCPINEVFSLCSTKCEPSCDSMKPNCDHSCAPPSCQCRPGFLRSNGKCVDPVACSTNQTASPPGDADTPTCAVVNVDCLSGYHCEDTPIGIRCAPDAAVQWDTKASNNNENEPFIPLQSLLCDRLCLGGTHCELVDGSPECVATEGSPLPSRSPCAAIECPEGQYCEFFDSAPKCVPVPGPCAAVFCGGGQCVEYDNTFGCFDTKCGQHEEFKICATCERTCETEKNICDDKCLQPACQCTDGYVRLHGKCVDERKCGSFGSGKFSKKL